jgi:ABC-type branched-subunit amino acid transport system substrate-binding protein
MVVVLALLILSAFMFNENAEKKKTIAVLLPLSGKYKPFGTKILKGIELASNIFSEEGSPEIEYLIADYESDEAKLNDLIIEMDNRDVIAIIGPAGIQACKGANLKNIPVFVFSQENTPAKEGSCCFGSFLTIDNQAKALLREANDLQIKRFAVLFPLNQFGMMFKDAFIKSAGEFGIEIAATKEYPDSPKDFPSIIRSLKEQLKKTTLKSDKSKPAHQVDALLIPDSARNASILAAYLSANGLNNLMLYGPSLWDTPELIRLGGKNIEGACFVSGFYLESSSYATRNFISDFNSTFDSSPSIWEASAYDTVKIIKSLIKDGNDTREKLKVAISSIKGYQGATGFISFDSMGLTKKDITVLKVIGGTVTEVLK